MKIGELSRHTDKLPIIFFIGALCVFSFGFGATVFKFRVFPYSVLNRGFDEWWQLRADPDNRNFLHPVRYDEPGTKVYDPERIMPGATLLTAFWPDRELMPGIRLIDVNGNTLNHWEVRPQEIWPESPYEDLSKGTKNVAENYVHGSYLYPNGDIVFNIEMLGLIRMDSCGEVLWKLPYRTHHSVDRDDEGNFWVAGLKWTEPGNERAELFPGITAPFTDSTILQVSPDGELLKEISLLESVYTGGYKHLLWHYGALGGNVLHLNDVEVLSSALAEQFPLFEAGDIVVSSRNLNFIAVMDQ